MRKSYQKPEIRCCLSDMQEILLPVSLPSSPSGPTVGAHQRELELMESEDKDEDVLW